MPHPEYDQDYTMRHLDEDSHQIWANIHASQLVDASRVGINRPEMMELSVWERELAIDAALEAAKTQRQQQVAARKQKGTALLEAIGTSFVLFSPWSLTAAYFRKHHK